MKKLFVPALALLGLLSLAACNGNKIDCGQVCAAYADCVDSDLDVIDCTRQCEDEADDSQDREDRLEACESCIEDQSCTEQAVMCTAECAGVIDPSA